MATEQFKQLVLNYCKQEILKENYNIDWDYPLYTRKQSDITEWVFNNMLFFDEYNDLTAYEQLKTLYDIVHELRTWKNW